MTDAICPDVVNEADLREQRPKIGETRTFATGEAIFLAPLPLPTGHAPLDLDESVLAVNDSYLDIGSSSKGTLFLIQSSISWQMVFIFCLLVFLPLLAGATTWFNPLAEPFGQRAMKVFTYGFWFYLVVGGGLIALSVHSLWSVMKESAESYPLRFNRQRREVCLMDKTLPRPIYVPWEDMVAWISRSFGTTGDGITETMTLGMAFDDPQEGKVQFVNWGVLSAAHGMSQWELIRSYMEVGPSVCPPPAKPDDRHSLERDRERLRQEQAWGISGFFFTFGWWYLRITSLWRVPYYLAELEQRFYRVKMPAEVEEWSRPLPKEQWAQPSEKLRQESARMRYALSVGHSFLEYCRGEVKVPAELPAYCYEETAVNEPLQPPEGAKRRGKKAAAFKRQAKADELARRRARRRKAVNEQTDT